MWMQVTVWHNTESDFWSGYQPGQLLAAVHTYMADVGTVTEARAEADRAFRIGQNGVDQAEGDTAAWVAHCKYEALRLRSVSVGDVVQVGKLWLKCEREGFLMTGETMMVGPDPLQEQNWLQHLPEEPPFDDIVEPS